MCPAHQFVRVDFRRFKAFESFSLRLRPFNILVGPNNSGKSTILAAFRILAAAMRKANTRRAEVLNGPQGETFGYRVDLVSISVAEENIFYNYDDTEAAYVSFTISNGNKLILYFPEPQVCHLIVDANGQLVQTPAKFKSQFDCPIGFVPILGPVEHREPLYAKEAARLALFNYRAARNFRNIWYHYPEKFNEFRSVLRQTWPGMDIEPPKPDPHPKETLLHMFCPEERIPREIFWSGFGFQVWCQMLTHLLQSSDTALFMIDEPDIYLHSDLQRQLLGLLRDLGPDIILATHSTEIVSEAEPDEILLVNKRGKSARRIKQPSEVADVFRILGSNLNPILTQLAKTRRAVFVEGGDFQIISRFARKIGYSAVSSRRDFAVVPVGGFSPDRVKQLKAGMEATLGARINAAAIFDRDFRPTKQCEAITEECRRFCDIVIVHERKEIENFLLVPKALDRAATRKVRDRARRSGGEGEPVGSLEEVLRQFSDEKKTYVASQFTSHRRTFARSTEPQTHGASVDQQALTEFDLLWSDFGHRLCVIPGKEALSFLNGHLQKVYGISITPTAIIDAMQGDEVPDEMMVLVQSLDKFSSSLS